MKKRRWFPFSLIPKYWGINEEDKEKERAKYYFDGKELDMVLLDLEKKNLTDEEFDKEYLNILYKYNEVTDDEYEKQMCDIQNKPYFKIIDASYQSNEDGTGRFAFELDWNANFIMELKSNGWPGVTPEEIIDNWFLQVCNQMSKEDIDNIDYLPSPTLYPNM